MCVVFGRSACRGVGNFLNLHLTSSATGDKAAGGVLYTEMFINYWARLPNQFLCP